MKILSKAIETTGRLDDQRHITLDEPLPEIYAEQVKVIVLIPEEDAISEGAWLRAAAKNPAFAFLHEAEEDIYSLEDGKAFHAQR